MEFRDDDRGAAVQVGVVILLAFVVLAIASYQATVVPSQNAEVEFNHNQQVRGEMQEVRNGVVSIPGGGQSRSATVTLGTTYPERTIFLNPPRPNGELRTGPPGRVTIENATATGEVGDFWTGDDRTYSTRALSYRPTYYEYESAPVTVYENSVVYDVQDGTTLVQSDQRIVDGRRITLGTLNGSYQEASSETVSVDLRGTSTSDNVVTVRNATDPVTITLPTRLSESKWRELLDGEFVADGGHVESVDSTALPSRPFDLVHVRLEAGVEYAVQMAKVGVGSGVTEPEATYVTDVEGDGETVTTGTNVTLVAEVRDRFNNPVSGEVVSASVISGDGSVTPADRASDSDGRVAFTYEAPDSPTTATVEAKIATSPTEAERVTFEVEVVPAGGPFSVRWDDPATSNPGGSLSDCSETECTWDVAADGDDELRLRVNTTPATNDAIVQYSVNDSSVATLNESSDTTGSNGTDAVNLTANGDGTVEVVVNGAGSTDVIVVEVTNVAGSNSPPTARFDYSPTGPDVGQTVSFDASNSSDSDGNVRTYQWDFGDGSTGNGETPTHTYSSSGTYTVTLTVTDNRGATDTTTDTVRVSGNDAPNARFSYSPSNPNTSDPVTFDASNSDDPDGTIVSYEWDFRDGTTGTGETTTHSYSTAGTYDVVLTVTDDDGATNSTTKTVDVGTTPPTANLSVNRSTVRTFEDVEFDASASSDPDGTIQSYEWDFDGDGTTDRTTSSPTVVHDYADDGSYDATVTVVDDDSATDTASVTVEVTNRPPTAALAVNRSPVKTFEDVEFDASGSDDRDGSVQTYAWDFDGDGTNETTTSSPTVVHDYADDGSYDATVTVVDDDGSTDAATVTVTVTNRAPTANFTHSCSGLNCTFDGSPSTDADGTVDTYTWEFGDGTTATTTDPTVDHDYSRGGTYDVTLTVTDDDGDTDATTKPVTVTASSGDDVTFVNGSAGTFSSPGNPGGGSGNPGDPTGSLEFTIENTGSTPATIVGFEVVEAGSATQLTSDFGDTLHCEEGKDEVYIDASADGCADQFSYDLGTRYSLNQNATLNGGTSATAYFYQFRDSNDDAVSLSGEPVEIVLYFADGSSTTVEFTPP